MVKKALVILLGAILSVFALLPSEYTSAQSSRPQWIDVVHLEYNGKTFVDSNPYDGTRNAKASEGKCTSEVDYSSDRSKIQTYKEENGSFCDRTEHDEDVAIANPSSGFIAGYRTAEDTIVIYSKKAGSSGSPPSLVPFKTAEGREDNTYYLMLEGELIENCSIGFDSNGSIIVKDFDPFGGFPNFCPEILAPNINEYQLANSGQVTSEEDMPVNVPGSSGDDSQEDADNSCESKGGAMGWILCPIVTMLDGVFKFLDVQIERMLEVDQTAYKNSGMEDAWKVFRNIAFSILVPIMLVMVISTALGFEFFSAYTVKRAFPRLIAAVLFIALSWNITTLMVDISNNVGSGTFGIITAPFKSGVGASCQDSITLSCLFDAPDNIFGGIITGLIQASVAIVGAILFIIFFGSGLLVAVIGAFVVLLIRELFILALILVAPLAILAWIFPGNDKLWKAWWSVFSKLLVMFPLIMALVAIGRVGALIINFDRGAGADGFVLAPILKLAAYIIPYALIPFTFKTAGGVFAQIAGMEENFIQRGAKRRQEKRADKIQHAKNFQAGGERTRFGRGVNMAMGAALNPRALAGRPDRIGKRLQALRQGGRTNQGGAAWKEDPIIQANQYDDKFLLALGDRELAEKRMAEDTSPGGKAAWERAMANASQVRTKNSAGTKMAAIHALSATGYQYSAGQEGYNELQSSVRKIVGNDEGSYVNAMNQAQFNLKNAGRYDLGGINDGAGYSYEKGIDKAGGYQAGQAKIQTHIAGAEAMLGVSGSNKLSSDEFAGQLRQQIAGENFDLDNFQTHHRNLLDAYNGATGGNKTEIGKQLDAIDSVLSGPTFVAGPDGTTSIGAVMGDMRERAEKNKTDAYRGQPQNRAILDQENRPPEA